MTDTSAYDKAKLDKGWFKRVWLAILTVYNRPTNYEIWQYMHDYPAITPRRKHGDR